MVEILYYVASAVAIVSALAMILSAWRLKKRDRKPEMERLSEVIREFDEQTSDLRDESKRKRNQVA